MRVVPEAQGALDSRERASWPIIPTSPITHPAPHSISSATATGSTHRATTCRGRTGRGSVQVETHGAVGSSTGGARQRRPCPSQAGQSPVPTHDEHPGPTTSEATRRSTPRWATHLDGGSNARGHQHQEARLLVQQEQEDDHGAEAAPEHWGRAGGAECRVGPASCTPRTPTQVHTRAHRHSAPGHQHLQARLPSAH